MKNKLFLMNLALCSVWLLAILGSRESWNTVPLAVSLVAVLLRITFAFTFNRKEKRSWIPLVGMTVCFGLMFYINGLLGIREIVFFLSYLLGNDYFYSRDGKIILSSVFISLIWLIPMISYFVLLFRKKLIKTELSYKDMFGAILVTNRKASNYSKLMLVAISVLYTGLSMDPRICRLACIVAPAMSYYFICKHYKIEAKKLWIIIISMMVFFYAQRFCDNIRIGMLAISFAAIVYVGYLFYNHTKQFLTTLMVILYIGMALPSLSIGYNQYACINYARSGMSPLYPFRGIFMIKTDDGIREQVGLRDRYGLIITPGYDDLQHYKPHNSWLEYVELRKCGVITTYDIANNKLLKNNDIDSLLQAKVYNIVNSFYETHQHEYDDRCQVRITNLETKKMVSNLKVCLYGNVFVDYDEKTLFPNDTISPIVGQCIFGEIETRYSQKKTVCYIKDVYGQQTRTSFRIWVNIGSDERPRKEVIVKLANEIGGLIKNRTQ